MHSGRRIVVALLLALPALSMSASSQPVRPTPEAAPRHILRRYSTADGLPGNYVSDITQTRDGTLWLIAGSVLTRFDGRTFEEVALPPMGNALGPTSAFDVASSRASNSTTSLSQGTEYPLAMESQGDTLWLSTLARRTLKRVGGTWRTAYQSPVTLSELLARPGTPLYAYSGDGSQATVWQGNTALLTVPATAERRGRLVPRIVIDRTGTLWAAEADRQRGVSVGATPPRTISLATGAFITAPDEIAPVGVRRVNGTLVLEDRDGRSLRVIPDTPGARPTLLTKDGRLLVVTPAALLIYAPDSESPERIPGDFFTSGTGASSVFEDREGTVWLGTGQRGVIALRLRTVQQLSIGVTNVPDASGVQVRSIGRARDNATLVAADGGRLLRATSAMSARLVPLPFAPIVQTIMTAVEDALGQQWVSYIDKEDRAVVAVMPVAVPASVTRATSATFYRDILAYQFVEDTKRDVLYALQGDTLWSFAPSAPNRAPFDTLPLGGWRARHLLVGADGTRYIAGERGVLVLPATGTRGVPKRYTADTGYPLTGARALHLDRNGALWIGMYGGGLARLYHDSLRVLERRDGLADNVVSSILEDDDGNFWMSGNRGVHLLTRADREAWVSGARTRVAGVLFDERAGLENPEGSGWFGARTDDGTLWFPSFGGAIVVPPNSATSVLPRFGAVTIGGVAAADSVFTVRDTITLPLGVREVAVQVASVSLLAPETTPLEYQLDGVDTRWRPVEADRTIRLTALPPGQWTLRVRGAIGAGSEDARLLNDAATTKAFADDANTDGAALPGNNPALAQVVFTVPPRFQETGAFVALMTVAFAVLLLGGIRIRTRVPDARARELRDEVEEQTRWLIVEQDRTAAALERAVETEGRLRELLTSKARSFASLSHELRTPMTLILEPVRELAEEVRIKLSNTGQLRFDTLRQAVQRLERLTAQFLDLADTQSGTLRMQRRVVNVSAFLKDAVSHTVPLAFRKSVHVSVKVPEDMPVSARIDPDHMDKVITNLLTNAIKHVPQGGEVQVTLWREDIDEPTLVLEVRDNGPGVHPEVVEHIFDPFYQGPNATEGMGLGLALTRDIVVQHGGRIELVQEPNAGAIFRVTLPRTVAGEPAVTEGAEHAVAPDRPLSPEAPAAPHAMSPASAADDAVTPYVPASVHAPSAIPAVTSSSPFAAVADAKELLGGPSVRVLLVEDDYDLREFLRERIGVQHEVRTAETGEEALTLMQEWTPDVVISDIIMPGIDGLALCRILKADPATRNIPIMLLTAKGSAEDQERGLMVGADEYLVKPVDVRQLLLRIENLVRLKRSIEQRFKDTMPAWASVLMRGGVGKTMDRDAEQFVARLYRLLVERVGDPALDIDAMARGLNVSRSLLYRRIRESLDCSPHDLLMEVRLEQAALMLRTTDNTVAAIGGRVGFRTAPHFTRRFVAHFGMTPGEYRRRMAGG